MARAPVVLITGTSTGIGRASAVDLAERGATVIATARNPDDAKDLQKTYPNVHAMKLDVTDEANMKRVVAEVIKKHKRIDALVNNAGYGVMLPQEEMSMESLRAMYEVNVFGLQRMTQLVLPQMRKQKSGRIINIASAAGHVSLPMMGAYSSTKFAVRALTMALRAEVKPFGIQAVIVEPGSIHTDFGKRSIKESNAAGTGNRRGPYKAMHRRWDRIRNMAGSSGPGPEYIAKMVRKAALNKKPKFRYHGPRDSRAGRWASRHVPDSVFANIASRYFWANGKRK